MIILLLLWLAGCSLYNFYTGWVYDRLNDYARDDDRILWSLFMWPYYLTRIILGFDWKEGN